MGNVKMVTTRSAGARSGTKNLTEISLRLQAFSPSDLVSFSHGRGHFRVSRVSLDGLTKKRDCS